MGYSGPDKKTDTLKEQVSSILKIWSVATEDRRREKKILKEVFRVGDRGDHTGEVETRRSRFGSEEVPHKPRIRGSGAQK